MTAIQYFHHNDYCFIDSPRILGNVLPHGELQSWNDFGSVDALLQRNISFGSDYLFSELVAGNNCEWSSVSDEFSGLQKSACIHMVPNAPKYLKVSHFLSRADIATVVEVIHDSFSSPQFHPSGVMLHVTMMHEDIASTSWTVKVGKFMNHCILKLNVYRNTKMCGELNDEQEEFIIEAEVLEGDRNLFYGYFNSLKAQF